MQVLTGMWKWNDGMNHAITNQLLGNQSQEIILFIYRKHMIYMDLIYGQALKGNTNKGP